MSDQTIKTMTQSIIDGYRLKKDDAFVQDMLTMPLAALQEGAGALQRHFCGNHVDFCTIINARSGRCGENCKYCAQAACHHTSCEEYDFLDEKTIMETAKMDQDAGANRFAMVTSGRALTGKDFDKALSIYKAMKKDLTIDLCASHGILSEDQLRRLLRPASQATIITLKPAAAFSLISARAIPSMTASAPSRPPSARVSVFAPAASSAWEKLGRTASIWPLPFKSSASSPSPSMPLWPFPEQGWKAALPFLPKTSCGPSPSSASLTRRQTSVLPQAGSCFLITGNRPCFTVHLLPLREICLPQAVQPSKKTWK